MGQIGHWSMDQMGHGSMCRGSVVTVAMGQTSHWSNGSWVNGTTGQMGQTSHGSMGQMGHVSMGRRVKWVTFWTGNMGHGSLYVDLRVSAKPTVFTVLHKRDDEQ